MPFKLLKRGSLIMLALPSSFSVVPPVLSHANAGKPVAVWLKYREMF